MQDIDPDDVLAAVSASFGRRIVGVISVALLGLLLIYLAIFQPPALAWQLFLLLIGAVSLWLAVRMWQATRHTVVLTETELRDTAGTVLATMDDIESIDRGFFAFKPSNGFLLTTKSPGPRTWQPGLWWRIGRRIGVGGMTPGAQSKSVSEIISIKVAQRDMGPKD
ncbi:hypothetical protein SAMN05444149_103321 [Pseudosulfitobacter pseudonitzschiae]|uniref:DUF304 domain-containing protein n=1 Tax=Pseudosulfitobacter pseudonitzschiae TaxID=1402135 RepID=A0A073JGD5_9RHOB|nr:hypothetical protein [Pseudosulfitobacter pseudonitzschiae]KEJ96777.1 hypothetical protein SUH3_15590 [Pseudosulfitobacter pseudonitzschiae]QKS07770.1 hypothetical protein HT745_04340 [Pseudosulfitobacter pseudonitzschiae]SHF24792.1 hypothetical protein SAMN05444149_103321 [Pseudosulfitobacter pseudonitzschiae]